MVLSLSNLAARQIPPNVILDFRTEFVLKNIHSNIEKEIVKLTEKREKIKQEYFLVNQMYYDNLLSENADAEVFACVNEMSQGHNMIIELRNQISFLKMWSPNYVKLDLAISKYIAWPSATAEKQELITIFYGIFNHHKEIVLEDPTDMELSLKDMIIHYVTRCKYWYNTLNTEVDEKRIISIAIEMKELAEDIRKIESKIKDFRDVYEHLNIIFETRAMDELWMSLVDLVDLNNNI